MKVVWQLNGVETEEIPAVGRVRHKVDPLLVAGNPRCDWLLRRCRVPEVHGVVIGSRHQELVRALGRL